MPRRIEVTRKKRSLSILQRKIEGSPVNVKTLTVSQIEATFSSV